MDANRDPRIDDMIRAIDDDPLRFVIVLLEQIITRDQHISRLSEQAGLQREAIRALAALAEAGGTR